MMKNKIWRLFVLAGVVMTCSTWAWSQPNFSPIQGVTNYLLPGLVYIEEDILSGEQVLYEAFPFLGVWMQFEVVRAPYIDAQYAGKGGALFAIGQSPEDCNLYGLNIVNGRIMQIGSGSMVNPWAGKRPNEWLRLEQHMGGIVFAYNPPDEPFIIVYKYSFALHELETKEIPKHLFEGELDGDIHMKLAPDAQHVAFVTKPKPVEGEENTYVSSLKVIHFSNMTTTTVTSAIHTRVTGGIEEAWPAFEFQSPSQVQYLTADISQPPTGGRSKWLYKTVEIEGGVNSEIFAATLPIPERAGSLIRHSFEYHMLYTHETDPPTRYLADHDGSRSLLVFPESDPVTVSDRDGALVVKANGKEIHETADAGLELDETLISYFGHRAFTFRHQDRDETQVWFYDPLGKLWAAAWTENPVRLIGVLEIRDPLREKI